MTSWQQVLDSLTATWEKRTQEQAALAEQEKAVFDALPEEEKKRIIALQEETERQEASKRAERVRQEAQEKLFEQKRQWQCRGITPRYFEATWENWIADTPEQKKAVETIKQAWNKNLFINGKNGTGKTHLAMCLAKEGAVYCLLPELFRLVRENLDDEQKTINNFGSCKLLILDEVGRQKGTDFERNLLFEIIDKRWNNMLPTTMIGNLSSKEFSDLCGTAILDRLRPEIVNFTWGSKRG